MGSRAQQVEPVDDLAFRRVLREFVTGVAVATASVDGEPVGMTVNSFTSVSLDPPLVLFCANASSVTGRHILRSGAFAVNILGREHWAIADRFADPVGDRFGGLQVAEGPTGSPILTDGLGFVDCRVVEAIRQGDHIIVVGEAIAAGARGTGAPLAFFRGSYVSATDPPSVVRKETQQRTSAVGVNSEPGGRT